jgi:hypothetical protein
VVDRPSEGSRRSRAWTEGLALHEFAHLGNAVDKDVRDLFHADLSTPCSFTLLTLPSGCWWWWWCCCSTTSSIARLLLMLLLLASLGSVCLAAAFPSKRRRLLSASPRRQRDAKLMKARRRVARHTAGSF